MIIAVDGPAASGKGTLARRLATHYGLPHLDTGLLYRAVGKGVLDAGRPPEDADVAIAVAQALDPRHFDEAALKADAIGNAASVVAAIPQVREALLAFQRAFAARAPGAVLDGRDIGTVIAPQAEAKIFVTASPEERARRRVLELQQRGDSVDPQKVLADILARDARDAARAVAPFRPAADAHLLDTTHLAIEPAIRAAIEIVEAIRAGRGRG